MHQRHTAADKIVVGMIEVVAVEIVNRLRQRTGTDKRIHRFIFKEETCTGNGLISIVAAYNAFAGLWS